MSADVFTTFSPLIIIQIFGVCQNEEKIFLIKKTKGDRPKEKETPLFFSELMMLITEKVLNLEKSLPHLIHFI